MTQNQEEFEEETSTCHGHVRVTRVDASGFVDGLELDEVATLAETTLGADVIAELGGGLVDSPAMTRFTLFLTSMFYSCSTRPQLRRNPSFNSKSCLSVYISALFDLHRTRMRVEHLK